MKKLHFIFMIPILGSLYFCEPKQKSEDKTTDTEQQKPEEITSGELKLDEFMYPFGITIPQSPTQSKKSSAGDCDTTIDEYTLENQTLLSKVSLNCGDYGTEMKYFVIKNNEVTKYHEQSNQVLLEDEESKYAREESFYMLLDDGTFQKMTRKDTADFNNLSAPISKSFEINGNISREDIQTMYNSTK